MDQPASENAAAAPSEVAAVTQTPTPPDEPPDAAELSQATEDPCGAKRLGRWLNVLPTDTVKAEISAAVGERAIRYYTQGDPITMDFSSSRLNVELGADGRIKQFRCG